MIHKKTPSVSVQKRFIDILPVDDIIKRKHSFVVTRQGHDSSGLLQGPGYVAA
jgi:hypothetical protein